MPEQKPQPAAWSDEWIDELAEEFDCCIGPKHRAFARAAAAKMAEELEAVLWERVGREEYGHAKAAVTLDIEAIRARARALEGGGDGD